MLENKLVVLPPPVACSPYPKQYKTHDTGVVDYGASNIFFAKEAQVQQLNADATKVHVGTTTGPMQHYVGMRTLELPNFLSGLCPPDI